MPAPVDEAISSEIGRTQLDLTAASLLRARLLLTLYQHELSPYLVRAEWHDATLRCRL
jgi:hypothetical protein